MCLAEEPAARRDKEGRVVRERIGCGVVRVEMRVVVVRSWVRRVCDHVAEYETVASLGWKIAAETGCGCEVVGLGWDSIANEPSLERAEDVVFRFLRCRGAEGCAGAGGELVGLVLQRPMVPSEEAVRKWFVGGWMEREFMAPLWPRNSARGVTTPRSLPSS